MNLTLAFWNCLRSLHPDPRFRYWTQKEIFFAMKTFWRRIKCIHCQKMTISPWLRRFDDSFDFLNFFWKRWLCYCFQIAQFRKNKLIITEPWELRVVETRDTSCDFSLRLYWTSKQSPNPKFIDRELALAVLYVCFRLLLLLVLLLPFLNFQAQIGNIFFF